MSSGHLEACINDCMQCHRACLDMATNHCLELGGKHASPSHIGLLLACAEICQAAANMMIIDSSVHKHSCRACAAICIRCADACEQMCQMDDCVEICRRCAESCEAMTA